MKRYKFLREGLKSNSGNLTWKINEWQTINKPLDICNVGLHCSKGIYQAFSYLQGEIIAEVEVKGKSIKQDDKECWEKMRIIRTWKWQKKDSVLFAIYAARLVLDNFEKVSPDYKCPREAIEAAEKYTNDPSEENRKAASAASSAASAAYAASSAKATVYKKLDLYMKNYLDNLEELK